MKYRRYYLWRSAGAGGWGLLAMGVIIIVIKAMIDVAYLVGGIMVLIGLALLLIGQIAKRT